MWVLADCLCALVNLQYNCFYKQKQDESLLEDVWTLLTAGRMEEACNLCRSAGQVSLSRRSFIFYYLLIKKLIRESFFFWVCVMCHYINSVCTAMEGCNPLPIWRIWPFPINWKPGKKWQEQNPAGHWIGKWYWSSISPLEMGFLLCIGGRWLII